MPSPCRLYPSSSSEILICLAAITTCLATTHIIQTLTFNSEFQGQKRRAAKHTRGREDQQKVRPCRASLHAALTDGYCAPVCRAGVALVLVGALQDAGHGDEVRDLLVHVPGLSVVAGVLLQLLPSFSADGQWARNTWHKALQIAKPAADCNGRHSSRPNNHQN